MRRSLVLLFACLAVSACVGVGAAGAGYKPGGHTPDACSGAGWSDAVGTFARDSLGNGLTAQRIYGLMGSDLIVGSATRASCVFGGGDDDVISLNTGGGVALGEKGNDLLMGSGLSDALSGGAGSDTLFGMAGADVLRGGPDVDSLIAGDGDDLVDAQDGKAEVIDCGPGADQAYVDGFDLLAGCEGVKRMGSFGRHKALSREDGGRHTVFRLRFVAPDGAAAGEYRVLLISPAGVLVEGGRWGAVAEGQATRLGLRPAGTRGWARGVWRGAVVHAPSCAGGRACASPPPAEPLAWLAFTVR